MFTREHDRRTDRRGSRRLRLPQIVSGVAFGVVGVLFASSAASAAVLDTYPGDPTEAEASILALTLGSTDIIGIADSHAGSVSNPGTHQQPFSASLIGSQLVDFGAGLTDADERALLAELTGA